MSAKGFTRGPWKFGKELSAHGGEWLISLDAGDRGRGIAIAETRPGTGSEQANARLIASAPTLLEALALAASKPLWQHCTDEEWEFIRGAILGAQGEQV